MNSKRFKLYAPISFLVIISMVIVTVSILTRKWVTSDVVPDLQPNRSVPAVGVGGGGSVEFGLLRFCYKLNFGLGTREKCHKVVDELPLAEALMMVVTAACLWLCMTSLLLQLCFLLYNVFTVPQEQILRDYGIIICGIAQIVFLILAIMLYTIAFLLLRSDDKLLPKSVQPEFKSSDSKFNYSYYILFAEVALTLLRTLLVFLFGSLFSTNRMLQKDVTYQPKMESRKSGELIF